MQQERKEDSDSTPCQLTPSERQRLATDIVRQLGITGSPSPNSPRPQRRPVSLTLLNNSTPLRPTTATFRQVPSTWTPIWQRANFLDNVDIAADALDRIQPEDLTTVPLATAAEDDSPAAQAARYLQAKLIEQRQQTTSTTRDKK